MKKSISLVCALAALPACEQPQQPHAVEQAVDDTQAQVKPGHTKSLKTKLEQSMNNSLGAKKPSGKTVGRFYNGPPPPKPSAQPPKPAPTGSTVGRFYKGRPAKRGPR